jgi:hypothetical protein
MSDLSKGGMPEDMMRKFAGWKPGSRMVERYLHTDQKDVINKIREIEGLPVKDKKPEKSVLAPVICPRCKKENPHDVQICINCNIPLHTQVAMDELKIIEFLRSGFYQDEKKFAEKYEEYMDIEKMANEYYDIILEEKNMTEEERQDRIKEMKKVKELMKKLKKEREAKKKKDKPQP